MRPVRAQKETVSVAAISLLACLMGGLVYLRERTRPECSVQWSLATIADMAGVAARGEWEHCQINRLMDVMYEVEEEHLEVNIPGEFMEKVRTWLGGKEDLVQVAKKQTVIQITNR